MSALPRNIQVFDHVAAVVLVRLYESFPHRIELPCVSIGIEVAEQIGSSEEEAFQLATDTVSNTIDWLEQEGYIVIQAKDGGFDPPTKYFGVVLTRQGMEVLGREATPQVLADPQARQPWGARLRTALRERSPEMVADAIGAVIRLGGGG